MGRVAQNLIGKVYGRLRVISRSCVRANYAMWNVVCECGKTRTLPTTSLTSGNTQSCGCLNREVAVERMTTHGMKGTRTHGSWANMMQRCYNSRRLSYKDYGGRGIIVCERWHTFENFYLDMGEVPEGLTLDRINNDGNYDPTNCKWSTPTEQNNNRRPRSKHKPIHNLVGKTYGKWVVLSYVGKKLRSHMWQCRCACGAVKNVASANLKNGKSTCCGCIRSARSPYTKLKSTL